MDRDRLEALIAAAAEQLAGEWLLVGGALVALWLEPGRTTQDVDLIGLRGTPDERASLLGLAARLGLPVEALNSAADFFVTRIEGWRDEIETFRTGTSGTVIYRPTPTLFLLLKAGRLSEVDLGDCIALLSRARRDGLRVDSARIVQFLDALPTAGDPGLTQRRDRLRALLQA